MSIPLAVATVSAFLVSTLVGTTGAGADASVRPAAEPYGSYYTQYLADEPGIPSMASADGNLQIAGGASVRYLGLPAGIQDTTTSNTDTYYRGTDNHLHVIYGCFDATHTSSCSPRYGHVTDLGQQLTSSPVTAVTATGANLVFARGAAGDLLVYRPGDNSRPWQSLGGRFSGSPATVHFQYGRRVDVFVVNNADQLWDANSNDNGQHFQWHLVQDNIAGPRALSLSNVVASTYVTNGVRHFLLVNAQWDSQITTDSELHARTFIDPTTVARDSNDVDAFCLVDYQLAGPTVQGTDAYFLVPSNQVPYTSVEALSLSDIVAGWKSDTRTC